MKLLIDFVSLMSNFVYKKKDFVSSREIKWCPGCGDYAILSAIQMAMAQLGRDKDKQCIVSGIGCSSRFPVYMNTYGFHTIHGRAPSVATGIRVQNPELDVWVITGDGDGLSIGGNHLMHLCRRNVDLVIILFNNRIYGLTKGQYSPTSEENKQTKSTPFGSIDFPLNPIAFALSCGASFVARTYDTNIKHMVDIFKEARLHKGISFIEVFQNCVIFNDKAFDHISNKGKNNILFLEDGQELSFSSEKDEFKKGLVGNDQFELLISSEAKSFLKHNTSANGFLLQMGLAKLLEQECVPMGIFRKVSCETYEERLKQQEKSLPPKKDLQELINGTINWVVK